MTESTALRVAVIGIGQRAYIAEHIAGSGVDAVLTAAADTTAEGRDRALAQFGPGIAVYSDHLELIAAGGTDAAIVTTPDFTHAAIAIDLLRAGIAVYLEKPIATTVEDADAVLTVAAFGIIGYVMEANGYPVAAMVLGIVMGTMVEQSFVTSLIKSDGSILPFFERPVSSVLAALTIGALAWPVLFWLWRTFQQKPASAKA